jgi:hypothetical protein
MIRITNGPPSDPHAHVQGNHIPIVDHHGPHVLYLAHANNSSSNHRLVPASTVYFWIKTCHERYAYAPRSTYTEPVQIGQALLQQLWHCGLVVWSVASNEPVHSSSDSLRLLSAFLKQRCFVDLDADRDVLKGRGGHGRRYVGHQAFLDHRDELRTMYQMASDETKNQVVTQLIDWVHGTGGRFVDSDIDTAAAGTKYYVMDHETTVRKAKQALREVRKQKSSPQRKRRPSP